MLFQYLEERLVEGERRLGLRLDDGTWRMLGRGSVDRLRSEVVPEMVQDDKRHPA
jgi:hypothetical protein